MAGNTVYVQGSYVDVHDNEVVNLSIDKAGKVVVGSGQQASASDEESQVAEDMIPETAEDKDLVEKLKHIFYNNEADVRQFLKVISGMPPGDITDLVNQWVKEKRISDYGNSRKGVLWDILNEAGLYTKSRQNWCRRVY